MLENVSSSQKFVITVGRQMGSGGRSLGRIIADRLGVPFYDKDLLRQAAIREGLSGEFFDRNDERRPSLAGNLISHAMGMGPMGWFDSTNPHTDDALYTAQCRFMHKVAEDGPCVIVGRTADYVLRDLPTVVNIFVHADMDDCVKRLMERSPELSADRARALAEKTNRARAAFYNYYTDKRWGSAAAYDMTFCSSRMSLSQIADHVIAHLQQRLNNGVQK